MHQAAIAHDRGLSPTEQLQAVTALQQALHARLIETHISYVLLTAERAFKIKKAVNLGFLDFGTLPHREFYCREELRLNRRTAPALYLDVLPLVGTPAQPRIGGDGEAIDWVLCMRAFAQQGLWQQLARYGRLRPKHIDGGIEALCALHHDAAAAAPDDPAGRATHARAPLLDTLSALRALCTGPRELARLDELAVWEASEFELLHGAFEQRAHTGRVRECHGDLHLGNVVQFEGRTLLFDCLEFNAALRWTDVMSDLAFITMDLRAHGLPQLAHRLINGYVERTGDHEGLGLLRYHQVYRALVRAKVAALRGAQLVAKSRAHAAARRSLHDYLDTALQCSRQSAPTLLLTHGFSGSGKTTLTQSLLEILGAVRLRADVERKRLFGLAPLARSDPAAKAQLYGDVATQATHARLLDVAALLLRHGYSVILDATFLAYAQRQSARALAEALGVHCMIIDFQAPGEILRQRVQARTTRADDASEADLAVLETQRARAQPLREDELAQTCGFDAGVPFDASAMADRWAPLLRRLAHAPA